MTPAKKALIDAVVLSTAYFPPIEFFALLARNSVVYLESHEHYCKQSWRNRCRILSPNGPLDLNIPVVHDGDIFHKEIKDIRVDYTTDWVRRTEYAIDTAYFSSPFFEYYRDEVFAILDSRPGTLWELDGKTIAFCCRKLGIAPAISETEEYVGASVNLSPKIASSYVGRPYWQVFRDRFGFVPGLSMLDLIFNEGPEALSYLL